MPYREGKHLGLDSVRSLSAAVNDMKLVVCGSIFLSHILKQLHLLLMLKPCIWSSVHALVVLSSARYSVS